jgi:hypothetical protein
MCNFVPGQAVAVGPMSALHEMGEGLPGQIGPVIPLLSEGADTGQSTGLGQIGSVTLRTEPGLEFHAVSRMSARLAAVIEKRDAVVDVNHLLPLSAGETLSSSSLKLSPFAEREADMIRRLLRGTIPRQSPPIRVAVLDSGLAANYAAHRTLRFFDYSNAGRLQRDAELCDPLGHGTRVVSILDQILPSEVELSVGRLPAEAANLTALAIARALGDIVAREQPDVVNLSVSTRNDWFLCPHCRQRVPAPEMISSLLPLVIRLAGRSANNTLTVMAAGNSGQIPNSRWLTEDVETLLFATAENRRRERTRYSSSLEGPKADLFSAGAFGGDDPGDPDAQGVFVDGTHGTSFAAPFVSATALLTKRFRSPMVHGIPTRIGQFTREVIEAAREGRFPSIRSDDA